MRQRPKPAPESAPRLLAIVGPTGAGKTRLGITIARAMSGEILSADSQQVYRGLDLGTAKPTAEERAQVRHHLIDIVEPTEILSAGEWARRADAVIDELVSRSVLPVVVGGTGLWLRALLQGIVDAPPSDPELRQRLAQRAEREGKQALYAELAGIDPESAAAINPENLVRVMRALEIWELSGEKPSGLRSRHGFARLRYRVRVLGLSPPREELYRRIDQRARAMFEAGLLEEVRRLVARGLRGAPALGALGYPQVLAAIDGRLSLEQAIERTAADTRHYAKRQLTWFRADPLVEWLPWPPDPAELVAGLEARR